MTEVQHTTLGDLITLMYEEFMALYGDPELASVAAAAVVNDLIVGTDDEEVYEDAA